MRLLAPIPTLPIVDLIEQHVEDAALHWLRRQRALTAPHYFFKDHIGQPGGDLGHLDRRLQAHLDGAHLGADLAWQIAQKNLLTTGEAPELFVAAILALRSIQPTRLDTLLAAVLAEPAAAPGLSSALGWSTFVDIEPLAQRLLVAEPPLFRAIGLAAYAIHRQEPPTLQRALEDPAPEPRRRALKAIGELHRRDLLPALRGHLRDPDPLCRYRAATSAALLGDRNDAEALLVVLMEGEPCAEHIEQGARLAACRLPSPALAPWITQWLGHGPPNLRRAAVAALGESGDPAVIPQLLALTTEPSLARLAGEAISRITGLDLVDQDLEADPPEADPPEDPTELDPDDDLPWPHYEALARWWATHAATWAPGKRYLLGRALCLTSLNAILAGGSQRERIAAAHHLLMLRPGPLFEHRAPAHRQQQQLRAMNFV